MTREETLKHFKAWCQNNIGNHCSDEDFQMTNNIMALLEQEPCEDAISRQAVKEQMIKYGFHAPDMTVTEFVEDLPPVNLQAKTGHCKDCNWWKDSDGIYRRGSHAESQCPINRREVFEGNGYCYMFNSQESEG